MAAYYPKCPVTSAICQVPIRPSCFFMAGVRVMYAIFRIRRQSLFCPLNCLTTLPHYPPPRAPFCLHFVNLVNPTEKFPPSTTVLGILHFCNAGCPFFSEKGASPEWEEGGEIFSHPRRNSWHSLNFPSSCARPFNIVIFISNVACRAETGSNFYDLDLVHLFSL